MHFLLHQKLSQGIFYYTKNLNLIHSFVHIGLGVLSSSVNLLHLDLSVCLLVCFC